MPPSRSRRGRRRRFLAASAVLVLLAGVFGGGYWYGYSTAKPHLSRQVAQLKVATRALAEQVHNLRGENRKLRKHNIQLQRSADIDRKATRAVRGSLSRLQDKVSTLQQRVAFYRSIVSPDGGHEAVKAYSFDAQPAGPEREYAFALTLIQTARHQRRVRGEVRVLLRGMQGGQAKSLKLERLVVGKHARLRFSFHYFQELDGKLKLPEGFKPKSVVVKVNPEHRKAFEKTYQWTDVIKDGA